jgi:hypothetical protein
MPINQLKNGDSGLAARTIINDLSIAVNNLATSGSASYAHTASALNPTPKVIAELFMHPQVITSNIVIPAQHNAFLVDFVEISGSVEVGEGSNLIII